MEQYLYDAVNWLFMATTHTVPESETSREYLSKQVMIASSTTPREDSGRLSPTPKEAHGIKLNKFEDAKGQDGVEIIQISDEAAKAMLEGRECAFMGSEIHYDMDRVLVVDSGATSTLSSSFENCTDCKEKVVEIQTAHGDTIMKTTHVCLKTFYVRDRLGTTRPITTRAFIAPGIKRDLLSGKALNRAGYRVILDSDYEEAGIYSVEKGKIDKAKSFPFMSELSSLFCLK